MKIYYFNIIAILCFGVFGKAQNSFIFEECSSESILEGTLPNGFRYFLSQNNQNEKMEIRFCVRVGANSETENEIGIAHFLEHLAFEGSANFKGNTAVSFWEKLGAKYGYHINAYTTYDRTIYTLSIPQSIDYQSLSNSIKILADWLENLSLSEKDIEKQRKIILQEVAGYHSPSDLNHIKRGKNEHLKRLPIGSKSDILAINQQKISDFYKKWYQPQNAAIVIVGNFDLQKAEEDIRNIFGKIKKNGKKQKTVKSLTFNELHQEKEDKKESLNILFPKKYNRKKSFNDILDYYKEKVALQIAKKRLNSLKINLLTSKYWFLEGTEFLEFSFENNQAEFPVFETISALEGLKKNGATPQELDYALQKVFAEIGQSFQYKTNQFTADEVVDLFIFQEKGLICEDFAKKIIEKLKNNNKKNWKKEINKLFSFKEKMLVDYVGAKKNSYKTIKNYFKQGKKKPNLQIPSEENLTKNDEIISTKIYNKDYYNEKMILSETYFPVLDLHKITLLNGVTIHFKKTENNAKTIISTLNKGGLNRLSPSDFKPMEDMISYFSLFGSQELEGEKFSQFLYNENLSFINNLENYFNGALGDAPSGKEPLLARLMVDKILNPEIIISDFEQIKQEELANFSEKNEKFDAENEFYFRKEEIVGTIFKKYRQKKEKSDIEAMDIDKMYDFYKQNYINPNEMSVFVVGNFNYHAIKNDFVATFSKIPNDNSTVQEYDYETNLTFNNDEEIFTAENTKNRINFKIIYYGKTENGLKNDLILKITREVFHKKIVQELREKQGLLYSPYLELDTNYQAKNRFFFTINAEGDSANEEKIKKAIQNTINLLKNSVESTEIQAIKKMFLENRKVLLQENMQWVEYLQNEYKKNISLQEIEKYEQIIEEITKDDIQNFIKNNIDENHKISLIFK